jgi:HPt (histidine-containing phosphotransfer) domain-containing protein
MIQYQRLKQIESLQAKGASDILIEFINAFCENSEKHVENLMRYQKSQQIENLTRSAHTLKSSSHLLGALELSRQCSELENCGARNTAETNVRLIKRIQSTQRAVCQELKSIARQRESLRAKLSTQPKRFG